MRGAAVVLALTLGCSNGPCRQGTLFLDLSLVGGAQNADTLDISLAIDGQPVGDRLVHRTSMRNSDSVVIVLPSPYPSGHAITLTLTALAVGTSLATTVDNFTAAHGCTARNLTLAGGASDLAGGTDDLALPSPLDLAGAHDLATAPFDLTVVTILIGETNVLAMEDSGNGNLLEAQPATLSRTATIESMSFYVSATAGQLVLGIYDATGSGGRPGALKAQTNAFTPTLGWNTQNVITPVSLTPGTYWLTYLPSDGNLHFPLANNSGTYWSASYAFAPMPSSFPTATSGTSHWSLYATLQ
jgi:hypothetical protein